MHYPTVERILAESLGLTNKELDRLSNIPESDIAEYARKIGVRFQAVASTPYYGIELTPQECRWLDGKVQKV